MFSNYHQGQPAFIPVRMLDVSGAPKVGVPAANVIVTLVKPDGLVPSGNLAGFTWTEYSFGSFAGQGVYGLVLPASAVDQAGAYIVAVTDGLGSAMVELDVQAADSVDVMNRLGTPIGASISADVAAAVGAVTEIRTNVLRLLGLQKANSMLDQQVYNPQGQLTSARLRCYDSAANAVAAGATGLLFEYSVHAIYDATSKLSNFYITQVS